ncbi:MAG: ASCH domain-containing protein [Patescibacteria group bacterium]
MKLQPNPFEAIKAGVKTIEIRLNDEKRQQIQAGDTIEFIKLPETQKTMSVQVKDLYSFATFRELFEAYPVEDLGGESVEMLLEQLYTYYSPEDEKKWGVLGIRVQLI